MKQNKEDLYNDATSLTLAAVGVLTIILSVLIGERLEHLYYAGLLIGVSLVFVGGLYEFKKLKRENKLKLMGTVLFGVIALTPIIIIFDNYVYPRIGVEIGSVILGFFVYLIIILVNKLVEFGFDYKIEN